MRTETVLVRPWASRCIATLVVLMLAAHCSGMLLDAVYGNFGVQTWEAFRGAKMQAMASGMDLTVPSRLVAWRMSLASAFALLVRCLFDGICELGVAGVYLAAIDNNDREWVRASRAGFANPISALALQVRLSVQVAFWSLLFVIPGIVAVYRYRAAWYLKARHSDWSAGKCLSASAVVMKGAKWRAFKIDCSYWLQITLATIATSGFYFARELRGTSDPLTLGLGATTAIAILWMTATMRDGQSRLVHELIKDKEKHELQGS